MGAQQQFPECGQEMFLSSAQHKRRRRCSASSSSPPSWALGIPAAMEVDREEDRCTSPIQGKRGKHGVLRSSCSKEIWGLHSILKPFWSQAFPLCASRPPPVGLSLSRIGTSTYLGKSQGHTGGAGSSQLCQDRGRLRKEVLRSKDILPELQKH